MHSTRLFLAPLIFTALWHVPLSFTMDNQSASQQSSTVDLRWAFAKMSHLVCATPETLHIKGAHKQGRTTASKVKLQQSLIHIFDALELLTDSQGTNVRLDLAKLEIFCAAVHECAKEVKSETHVCLDDTLEQLSQTPPEKVFIQGLPCQKKESQTAIVERICTLPNAITLQQDGTATLSGPLIAAFVYDQERLILDQNRQNDDKHLREVSRLLNQRGRLAAQKYCDQQGLSYDDIINLLM